MSEFMVYHSSEFQNIRTMALQIWKNNFYAVLKEKWVSKSLRFSPTGSVVPYVHRWHKKSPGLSEEGRTWVNRQRGKQVMLGMVSANIILYAAYSFDIILYIRERERESAMEQSWNHLQ